MPTIHHFASAGFEEGADERSARGAAELCRQVVKLVLN